MKKIKNKIGKLKTPSEDRVFSVDRGGVGPLERDNESAPKNRSDSALVHEQDISKLY